MADTQKISNGEKKSLQSIWSSIVKLLLWRRDLQVMENKHLVKGHLDVVIIDQKGNSGEKMSGIKKIKKDCQIFNQPLENVLKIKCFRCFD